MRNKILPFLFTTIILAIVYFTNVSFSTGPPVNSPTAGCSCHGAANANTIVSINFNNGGAMVYNNGQTYPLVITVNSNANKPGAGFAMSYNIGTLTPTTPGTAVVAGVWRHNTPRAMTGANPSTASWTANWTAPDTGATLLQFKAAGNAVSLSNGSALDHWNFAPTQNIPLPVYFETLTVTSAGFYNKITWEVLNEKNIKEYQIQVSSNGVDFSTIQQLPALNTPEKHSYTWLHPTHESMSVLYYRIMATDLDGQEFYSITESLKREINNSAPMLFPNVTTMNTPVKVKLASVHSNDEILILNAWGSITLRTAVAGDMTTLSTNALAKGMYYVVLNTQNKQVFIDRLLIQ